MDNDLRVHEEFIGIYEVYVIETTSLVVVIKYTLVRLNISLAKLRGQCNDRASNMSGVRPSMTTLIQGEQCNASFLHTAMVI